MNETFFIKRENTAFVSLKTGSTDPDKPDVDYKISTYV
jgi:hypothetical protein